MAVDRTGDVFDDVLRHAMRELIAWSARVVLIKEMWEWMDRDNYELSASSVAAKR
jgi:hypothetical protein